MGWVGVENLQLSGLPVSQGGLSERQVRGLVAAGWELDTQGYNHAALITLDASELHFQVTVARQRIRALYGVHADWFCYPSGQYDAAVIAEVKRSSPSAGALATIGDPAAFACCPARQRLVVIQRFDGSLTVLPLSFS